MAWTIGLIVIGAILALKMVGIALSQILTFIAEFLLHRNVIHLASWLVLMAGLWLNHLHLGMVVEMSQALIMQNTRVELETNCQ